jgi:hypothetical protein
MQASDEILSWLLEGDPAIAWQAQRDLADEPPEVYETTRARVAGEGWGARLLEERAADGSWGGGLYGPKWISTFYTMRLLQHFGLDGTHPAAVESCALLLDEGVQGDGGVRLWSADWRDDCVTAMLISLALHFGHARDERVDAMVEWLLAGQLDDGGWNCNVRSVGCRVSSFHTTLSALEALAAFGSSSSERATRVASRMEAGHDYFLRHRLYRSERTGDVVRESFTRFSFPPRWFFDVLKALEHFASVRAPWDERLADAVALVHRRRRADGRWNNQNHHTGREHFRLEAPRERSRWNTLRALRVLRWADAART